jgi:DNA repair photolyase
MPIVPLIAEHDTWISLDPIIGCPASCEYCYLHAFELTTHRPEIRIAPEALIARLRARFGERGPRWAGNTDLPMPMCIGNYTDQLMTRAGVEFLSAYLPLHAENFPNHPLCVVTKARLRPKDIEVLDRVGHRVLVFLSQSFIQSVAAVSGLERGPISKPSDTVENAGLLAQSRNLIPLHFWRPLSPTALPDLETA